MRIDRRQIDSGQDAQIDQAPAERDILSFCFLDGYYGLGSSSCIPISSLTVYGRRQNGKGFRAPRVCVSPAAGHAR